jgi:hypothetical protein
VTYIPVARKQQGKGVSTDMSNKPCYLFVTPGVIYEELTANPVQLLDAAAPVQLLKQLSQKTYSIIGRDYWISEFEFQLSSLSVVELLSHGDTSGTQRKGNVRRWKPVPEGL